MNYQEIIEFWFEDIETKQWYKKDDVFDDLLRTRFLEIHKQISEGNCSEWRKYSEGTLAEIIVLDQFSRNMFRGSGDSFAYDSLALDLAKDAVLRKVDLDLTITKRSFLYMPYMHSEVLKDHDEALVLFSQTGMEANLSFEHAHRAIIEKFGRFPHRNAVLCRASTDEEIMFLETNSGF
ncbi:DUF924 domain-containing protein [Candidatus Marinamargulisbacteria bacterium SCGC AAA071-K20]|nr:DUF924 domain-containing protein [Candidatus Marinamargulisbacteria bacterium SCGC AAA071-K20]